MTLHWLFIWILCGHGHFNVQKSSGPPCLALGLKASHRLKNYAWEGNWLMMEITTHIVLHISEEQWEGISLSQGRNWLGTAFPSQTARKGSILSLGAHAYLTGRLWAVTLGDSSLLYSEEEEEKGNIYTNPCLN